MRRVRFRNFYTLILLITIFIISGCSHFEKNYPSAKPNAEQVVLAHGLGRSDWAMWRFAQRLQKANYEVCRLNYDTLGESVSSVLAETEKQIDHCILGAPKVHFIGHSLGGLVIRAYLSNNKQNIEKITVGKVLLIGTPNKGSELADHFNDSWLMDLGGGISRALITGRKSLGNNLDELELHLGVIAGTKSSCLTGDLFKGPNDGLVSVDSTKLKSMSDFITIEVSHSQMRYNLEVTEQTLHFLKEGRFKH